MNPDNDHLAAIRTVEMPAHKFRSDHKMLSACGACELNIMPNCIPQVVRRIRAFGGLVRKDLVGVNEKLMMTTWAVQMPAHQPRGHDKMLQATWTRYLHSVTANSPY